MTLPSDREGLESNADVYLGEVRGKRLAQGISNLPTLPAVASRVIQMIDDPLTSPAMLSRIISQDQVLATKLLKLANSCFYGVSGRVRTIKQAIVLLGFNDLRALTLGISVITNLSQNWKGYFDYHEFWAHTIGCSFAADLVARVAIPAKRGEAFVCGLIHDIGKLVLSTFGEEYFDVVLEELENTDGDFHSTEKQRIGVSHAEIGAWYIERCNFPAGLVDAIRFHHDPLNARKEPILTAVVHFADFLVRRFGIGFPAGRNMPKLEEGALSKLLLRRTEEGLIDYTHYKRELAEAITANRPIFDVFIEDTCE